MAGSTLSKVERSKIRNQELRQRYADEIIREPGDSFALSQLRKRENDRLNLREDNISIAHSEFKLWNKISLE